jgi:hypothetical protein
VRRARSDSAAACRGEARRRSGVRLLRRRGCYVDAWGEERTGGGRLRASALLGEKTDRGGGTRASGPAQPSPGHGERAARRRAVERGKGKRAHLGDGGGAPGGAWLRRRFVARKLGDGRKKLRVGRLLYRNFARSVCEETQCVLASWRVGPTGQRRRQARNRLHARSRWARWLGHGAEQGWRGRAGSRQARRGAGPGAASVRAGLRAMALVAELPELFQLKCLSPAVKARPHLNGNNPSIPRI